MPLASSMQLLKRVALRLDLLAIGRRFHRLAVWGLGAWVGLLVVSRLTGYGTEAFNLWTLAVVPAVCLLLAVVLHRRQTAVEAARAVDLHGGTKDLFLTVALLDKSMGEFQPLVATSAEERAPRIAPVKVVPFDFLKPLSQLAGLGGLGLLAFLFLHQFDPFGQVEAATAVEKKHKELTASREETATRKAQLKPETPPGEVSEETRQAVEGMKAALNKMRPAEKAANTKELSRQQKSLGQMWQKLGNEKLRELFNRDSQEQQLGSEGQQKLRKWTDEMQQGESGSMQQELDEALDDLQRLAQTSDPVEKSQLEQSLRKRLKDLNKFAKDQVGSEDLSASLQRALKQLEMSKLDGVDPKEAAEALRESLQLSKRELQEVAQSVRDMKKLEESLATLQAAKRLNQEERLDGEATEDLADVEDYREFYNDLMDELGLDPATEDQRLEEMAKQRQAESEAARKKQAAAKRKAGQKTGGEKRQGEQGEGDPAEGEEEMEGESGEGEMEGEGEGEGEQEGEGEGQGEGQENGQEGEGQGQESKTAKGKGKGKGQPKAGQKRPGQGQGQGEGEGEGEGEGQGKGKGKSKSAQKRTGRGQGEGQGEGEGEGEGGENEAGDSDSEGDGPGMGGRGTGRGGKAEEDPDLDTEFITELSKSPVTRGKVLATQKSKGVSDKGDDRPRFRNPSPKSQQAVRRAIEQEQIPPGYHDSIKKYFKDLKDTAPAESDAE